jgi:simple sugar transport system permease protein
VESVFCLIEYLVSVSLKYIGGYLLFSVSRETMKHHSVSVRYCHNVLVYLGIAIALLMWWYLKYTKAGLKLRAVGENPAAADSVGINITLYRYLHNMIGSGIMGIGGYYMGLKLSGSFEGTCWINGYGWISVALVIFANWNTAKAILGTLVFGFFNALQVSKGALAYTFPNVLGWLAHIPIQLFQALPFIITAIVLIVSSIKKNSKSGEPAAKGLNYFREDR